MAKRYYFLLTSLPSLPELGEVPPIDLRRLRELTSEESGAAELVDAVLLEHDLILREASLAGEIEQPEPLVLTAEQATGQEPLPEFLAVDPQRQRRIPADVVWETYFRYVGRLAHALHNAFLREWVGFEVALRNALVVVRARKLELDPHEYLVCEELASPDSPVEEIVTAWSAAPEPLSALRALDQGRWRWTEEHSRYFSFASDELAAYARKLILVTRWHLLSREQPQAQAQPSA